jgi:hypothetical protein
VKAVRPGGVLLVGLSTGVLAWLGLRFWEDAGNLLPPVPWTALAGIIALAVAVVVAGLPVRRWQSGRRMARLDPLVAARTVVLAKAAAYTGAVISGWYAAQAVVILPDVVGARRTRLLLASLSAIAAIGVAGAGLLVQRWCRLPPDDNDNDDEQVGAA